MNVIGSFKQFKTVNPGSAFLIIAMLLMIVIPLPPFILDLLFSFNIAISLLILMACIYIVSPLEFNLFPTVLLVTTLLRLTLNIASTRVVLLHGNEGPAAAGDVIKAFGEVVIGGNFVVGMIIFIILMIINFIVVTKGAGRISEVTARFTLDAMPGKQMAIDADLNSGIINQDEAKKRRRQVIQESEFYGSMDGASKFVRGDAIAGLLILFINLIGGVFIGVFQHDMSFDIAMENFSILTIGDGLVAQIPSLLLSISAAIIVTRVSSDEDISEQTRTQLFTNPKPLIVTSIILFSLALVPKMPHLPLMGFAVLVLGLAVKIEKGNAQKLPVTETVGESEMTSSDNEDLDWSDVAVVDRISLEIGYGLISLIGVKKEGKLISRIRGIRKKISREFGFLIPTIHVKDNIQLSPNAYRVYLKGVVIAESNVYIDKLLAINPGHVTSTLPGVACKDPTFNLDAFWIPDEQKPAAEGLGFTIVDASTVIATNINQVIRTNLSHILGYEEVYQLISRLTNQDPKLAEAFTSPATGIPINIIFSILQRLLHAGVPIIDFRTIAEKMVDAWSKSKDQDLLMESVRVALKHLIIYSICGNQKELPVAVIDHDLAQILLKSIQLNQNGNEKMVVLEPSLMEKICSKLLEFVQSCHVNSLPAILLVSNELRYLMERLFKPNIPTMHFLSFAEVPEEKQIKIIEKIG
jgi:flagellar biosynthesis protein FlhA